MSSAAEQVSRWAHHAEARAARHGLAVELADQLRLAGRYLGAEGYLLGCGRVDGTSARGNGDDRSVAAGYLAQVAGSLVRSVKCLVDVEEFYAAASLGRQLVEVEYLLWAFAANDEAGQQWLNSTPRDRRSMWQPRHLRERSGGRFRAVDYSLHCEFGGHPTPDGLATLIGERGPVFAELMLADALQHAIACWSFTSQITELPYRVDMSPAVADWHAVDQLFAAAGRQMPPTDTATRVGASPAPSRTRSSN